MINSSKYDEKKGEITYFEEDNKPLPEEQPLRYDAGKIHKDLVALGLPVHSVSASEAGEVKTNFTRSLTISEKATYENYLRGL